MIVLLCGLLLFTLLHLLPAALPDRRAALAARIGNNAVRGLLGIGMLAGLVLVVMGWKSTDPAAVYIVPPWGRVVTLVAMLAASVLFFAPYVENSLRRNLRHPQLTALILFGVGHLFAVGHGRSLLLFGGLAVWAIGEMVLLNRRDGAWRRPGRARRKGDAVLLAMGLVFFVVALTAHPYLFGASPLPI